MIVSVKHNNIRYTANLKLPMDISIPINSKGARAWNISPLNIEAVKHGDWVGDVKKGSSVNFNNIFFNPHAHTTHTECVGHISLQKESLNEELSTFFFISKLITVIPKKKNKDCVITKNMLKKVINKNDNIDALIIRTLPNDKTKIIKNYSNTNHPYLLQEAAQYIADLNIKHLLIDLPSIDKEKDDGRVDSHKSFWGFPNKTRHGCTITELIYVPNNINEGKYLLNLQFVPFENDASPSRPILFKLVKDGEKL